MLEPAFNRGEANASRHRGEDQGRVGEPSIRNRRARVGGHGAGEIVRRARMFDAAAGAADGASYANEREKGGGDVFGALARAGRAWPRSLHGGDADRVHAANATTGAGATTPTPLLARIPAAQWLWPCTAAHESSRTATDLARSASVSSVSTSDAEA